MELKDAGGGELPITELGQAMVGEFKCWINGRIRRFSLCF